MRHHHNLDAVFFAFDPYTMSASTWTRSCDAALVLRTFSKATSKPPSRTQRRNTSTSVTFSGCEVVTDHVACSSKYRLQARCAKRNRAGRGSRGCMGPLYMSSSENSARRREVSGPPSDSLRELGHDPRTPLAHYGSERLY